MAGEAVVLRAMAVVAASRTPAAGVPGSYIIDFKDTPFYTIRSIDIDINTYVDIDVDFDYLNGVYRDYIMVPQGLLERGLGFLLN